MKRFLLFFVCFALIFTSTGMYVCAAEPVSSTPNESTVNAYGITEYVDDNNTVIRIYEATSEISIASPHNSSRNSNRTEDYQATKDLLAELGMGQSFIDNLTTEDLEDFSKGQKMVASIAYVKTDSEGNQTYIDEHTALTAVSDANVNDSNINTRSTSNTVTDSYMRLFYLVTDMGDGLFFFSVQAQWLRMPFWRFTDILGACSQDFTRTPSSMRGYYRYDVSTSVYGNIENTYVYHQFEDNEFVSCDNGTWSGVGVRLNLPADINVGNEYGDYILHSNLTAQLAFRGHHRDPSAEHYFNTVGSYTHYTLGVTVSPTISMGLDGFSASVSLGATLFAECRGIEFEMHYLP